MKTWSNLHSSGRIKIWLVFLYLACLLPLFYFHKSPKHTSDEGNRLHDNVPIKLVENNTREGNGRYNKNLNPTKPEIIPNPGKNVNQNGENLESSPRMAHATTLEREHSIKAVVPKIRTDAQCYEVAKSGSVDVLGQTMGSGHYCVVDNVCVDEKGTFVLFDDERDQQVYQFPRLGFDNLKFTRYENTSAPTFFNTTRKIALEKGLTILLKPTYCCVHIRHFAESLPTLLLSLMSLKKNTTVQEQTGIKPDFFISQVVLVTKANWIGFYVKFMLESVLRYQSELKEDLLLETFTHNRTTRCFERAIVPGSSFLLFHNEQMGDLFRDSLYKEISRTDRYLPPRARMNVEFKKDSNGLIEFDRKERVVLVASRTSKRSIIDKDEYYEFLRTMAAQYGAVIKVVEFGELLPYYQARNCMESSMLWSIHGNDLTNMMLMQRGSAIVELNPLFFFEPGYYEMAKNLGIHYFTWTCTTPSCAFGGNTTRWNEEIGSRNNFFYNETSREITMQHKDTQEYYEPFIFPETGYVGYACEECNKMSFDSALSDIYYSGLRESNIKVMPYKKKLETLFHVAANEIGWDLKGGPYE